MLKLLSQIKLNGKYLYVTWKGKVSIEMLRIVIVNGELHNGQD